MAATRKKATKPKKSPPQRAPRKREVRPEDLEPKYPWERQPKESPQAFTAFAHYLNMGEERSARETGRTLRKNWSQISKWSSAHDWVRRSEAYDRHHQKLRQRANQRAIMKMNERQAEAAMMGQAAAMLSIGKHVKTDKNQDPVPLRDRDAIRLLAVAAKLERVARGEPDSIQETKGDVGVKLSTVDERRASMVKLLENPEAVKHMAEISKLLGTDGGHGE